MGQHDRSYRTLFSHPFLVESLIRGFLPGEWIRRIDFTSLEAIGEAHATRTWNIRHSDRIWRLKWRGSERWIYIYLVLEFQRTDEPFMAMRVLAYASGLYEHLRKALKPKRGDKLPVVVPVVIYNGLRAWHSSTEVSELVEEPPPELRANVPRLSYHLFDIHRLPRDQLAALDNAAAQFFRIVSSPDLQSSEQAILALEQVLRSPEHDALRQDFAQWLTQFFLPSRLPGVTVKSVEKLEEIQPMITENTIDWTWEWKMAGREEGRKEGHKEGRQEGRQEGGAQLLTRLLERKFGLLSPALRQRLAEASSEQLFEWGERFVDASSIAEVFGDA